MREFQYEGTTATTVLLWKLGDERYLQAANVGDSHAYL
jgi:serine/threonine protein phosphatase PrpC